MMTVTGWGEHPKQWIVSLESSKINKTSFQGLTLSSQPWVQQKRFLQIPLGNTYFFGSKTVVFFSETAKRHNKPMCFRFPCNEGLPVAEVLKPSVRTNSNEEADMRSVCLLHETQKNIWATKKTSSFPLNPGWLIGILTMVYYNPYVAG